MGILVILITIYFLLISTFKSTSPLMMTLKLSFLSILMMLITFDKTQSSFLSCSVIISFSSGMMIMFSYCSIFSSFKMKTKTHILKTTTMMTLFLLFMMEISTKSNNQTFQSKLMLESSNSLTLFLIMVLILLSMIAMNSNILSKKKMLLSFY